jgi:hypothetical protein
MISAEVCKSQSRSQTLSVQEAAVLQTLVSMQCASLSDAL